MVGESSWPCKYCGRKLLRGIVLVLWTSSSIVINLLGSANPLAFTSFFARGSNYRMIRSLPTSDKEWKKEFFFVSGPWARDPESLNLCENTRAV